MQEIIYRRYSRGLKEIEKIKASQLNVNESKFSVFPDLILIDGGKGHVNVVKKVLEALSLELEVCGMIKDDYHRTKALYYNGQTIDFGESDEAYKYIYKIQEEVHRFAINYHKTLRRKNMTKSVLDEINGVGEKRRRSLIKYFKSVDNIKLASIEELAKVEGISEKTAEKIYNFFNN
jgi:excinuclease ABC subunit C